jgi:two-component system, NarL family, response regulator YdfI
MTRRNGGGAIRVLLAAASADRQARLETILRSNPALKLVGSLRDVAALSKHSAQLNPDLILLDAELGLALRTEAGTPVVLLADGLSTGAIARALRNGVRSILPRDAAADEIFHAIQAAHAGLVLLDAPITLALAARIPSPASEASPSLDELTSRELEVLRMLAEGLGNREMASRLRISDHTVKFHISSILDKLGASSRTEAVTLGIRAGLILL